MTPYPSNARDKDSLKAGFLEILHGTCALISWHGTMGVEYINISPQSIDIMGSWGGEQGKDRPGNSLHGQASGQQPENQVHKQLAAKQRESQPHKQMSAKQQESQPYKQMSAKQRESQPHKQLLSDKVPEHQPPGQLHTPVQPRSDAFQSLFLDGNVRSKLFFFTEMWEGTGNKGEGEVLENEKHGNCKKNPYSGPAGELFLKILQAMHLTRDGICLCTFQPLDYSRGIPAVRHQVNLIRQDMERHINEAKPEMICTMGDNALKILMGREYLLSRSRGRFQQYHGSGLNFPVHVMPTHHPAMLFENIAGKKEVWEDMKQIMVRGGL